MSESDIYHKTEKGKQEMANPSGALSMMHRRVLIMLNGNTPIADVRKRSFVNDFDSILKNLVSQRFIELPSASAREPEAVAKAPTDSSASRQLMINTLKAFGNQVRIRGLLGEIEAAADLEELKNLLPRWYQAIAETPNGMYQADDLRKDLKKLMGV